MNDSAAHATTTAATRRRWVWPFAALLLIGAAAFGGYVFFWERMYADYEPPEIALLGVETRVVEEVEKARAEVVMRPTSPDAWGKVGLVLFINGLYPEAQWWLERAERMNPADAKWPYYRGMMLLLEKPEEALELLKRAAELAPKDEGIRLRLAETLLLLDRADEADAAFAEVMKRQPGNPRALLGQGLLLLRRGKPSDAVPLLRQAAQHPTARKAGHAALAEAFARTGDDAAAEEERRHADAAPKDPGWPDQKLLALANLEVNLNARLRRARGIIAGGQAFDGLELAKQIVHDRPESAEARLTLAKGRLAMREFDEAEAELRRALERDSGLAEAHVLMGGFQLTVRRDPAAAERSYRRSLELRPGDALAYYNIAQCRLQQQDKDAAIETLKEAVRYRPGFAAAHLALGELHLEAGRTDSAITSLEAAAKLEPANEKIRDLLAKARKK